MVLKVDRFGNVITNLSVTDCPHLFAEPTPAFKIAVGGKEIQKLSQVYSDGEPNEVFAIRGSSGFLELATNRGAAAQILNVNRGAEVLLEIR
jgi:S-adenosylmethionine hydrolase